LKLGTTSLEIKSGYGLDLDSELKMLRVIKRLQSDSPMDIRATLLAAHAVPLEFKGRRSEYLDYVINDILPAAAPYVAAVDIFVEIGFFEADDARRLAVAAAAYDVGMRLHVDQLHDGGGAALAAELGAVSADHLEQTSIAGIEALAKADIPAVLLPGSVYGLGLHKYPDARAMIEAGASVVLATDFNPGSSPTPSLQMVMSLACTQMGMSPAEALAACTSRAAPVLGWESRVGRIEPGMQADLIVWDTANFRDVPYLFGHNHVQQVWKRGACVA
jgi:imidazolonepropionase